MVTRLWRPEGNGPCFKLRKERTLHPEPYNQWRCPSGVKGQIQTFSDGGKLGELVSIDLAKKKGKRKFSKQKTNHEVRNLVMSGKKTEQWRE